MRVKSRIAYMVAAVGLAAGATAFAQESVNFAGVESRELRGDAANIVLSHTFSTSFTLDNIRVYGTLSEILTATFASEARIAISGPGGSSVSGTGERVFTTSGFTGSISTPASGAGYTGLAAGTVINAGDTYTFEFYESFNDGAGADAIWDNIRFDFNDMPFMPPPPATVGSVSGDGFNVTKSTLDAAGEIDWYELTVSADGTPVEIDTSLTALHPAAVNVNDTELGLYDSLGNLITSDDDGGLGLYSRINRTLNAGTYYVAVGAFNTSFSAGFNVTSTSSQTGTYALRVVPAPGALALIGLGGLVATRRRR